ncbi:MAG: hypothetical protein KQI62_21345 [Deltaproteobacteria bacterium]|nr:hypothetical protein [Deltaproteobacteria bacterium]
MSYLNSGPSIVNTTPWTPLPAHSWSGPERWAWEQIRRGNIADFNAPLVADGKEPLDVTTSTVCQEDWERCGIRANFLRTILFCQPWCDAITHKGIRIIGAAIEERLLLDSAQIDHEFQLEGSILLKGFCCSYSYFKFNLSLEKSYLDELDARGVHVKGLISLRWAIIANNTIMDGAGIKGGIFLKEGRFGKTRLPNMRVGNQADCRATFTGTLNLNKTRFNDSLFLEGAVCKDVDISGANIGGKLALGGVQLKGKLILKQVFVKSNIELNGAEATEADLSGMEVKGNLYCQGTAFNKCILSQTSVDTVYDGKKENRDMGFWPEQIKIDRFVYRNLRGEPGDDSQQNDSSDDPSERCSWWYKKWLGSHHPYTPKPYRQCAKSLRESGHPGRAKEILFLAKERERKAAFKQRRWGRWMAMLLLEGLIGYGLGWRFKVFPLMWAILLLAAGMWVSYGAPVLINKSTLSYEYTRDCWWCLGLSLDRLLPVVQLGKDYSDCVFIGWRRFYFIAHTLCGWALALFIAAGLAGVAKPGGRD